MNYVGRPGISPALAALIALDEVRKADRILDAGCGSGTDALTLARWGFRHVDAIDPDGAAIRAAKSRATRLRLGRRVRFQRLAVERLAEAFAPASFHVVLHTLVANNLTKDQDAHFRELAKVLKPDGIILLHERIPKRHESKAPGRFGALPAANKYFDLGPGVMTHLAEHPSGRRGPQYARVVLWIGRRR